MKRFISIILSLIFALSLCSCSAESSKTPQMYSKTFVDLFDTSCTISAFDDSESSFNQHFDMVYNELKQYSNYLDIYTEHKDNLYSLNKDKSINSSTFLSDFLSYSKKAYDITSGKVNVAFGSVLSQWHNARENALNNPNKATLPSMEELKNLSSHTSISSLKIDDEKIYITDDKVSIDAGAIAKGYACEQICRFITNNQIWTDCIINLGGNIKVLGSKNGEPFNIAIENPRGSDYLCTVNAANGDSVVTSGDYERYFELDGKRYCHIIDVDTLMPCDLYSSVTVISKDAALADTMSTCLFSVSIDDGKKLIKDYSDIKVMWVDKKGIITTTDNWRSN